MFLNCQKIGEPTKSLFAILMTDTWEPLLPHDQQPLARHLKWHWRDHRETAAHEPIDLVLMDIGMPGMDGYEVVAKLRRLPSMAQVRMIALTGYCQPANRASALAAGFDEHTAKPVDPQRLAELLR